MVQDAAGIGVCAESSRPRFDFGIRNPPYDRYKMLVEIAVPS